MGAREDIQSRLRELEQWLAAVVVACPKEGVDVQLERLSDTYEMLSGVVGQADEVVCARLVEEVHRTRRQLLELKVAHTRVVVPARLMPSAVLTVQQALELAAWLVVKADYDFDERHHADGVFARCLAQAVRESETG